MLGVKKRSKQDPTILENYGSLQLKLFLAGVSLSETINKVVGIFCDELKFAAGVVFDFVKFQHYKLKISREDFKAFLRIFLLKVSKTPELKIPQQARRLLS